ncbi:ubiquitin carboxyl-terminal hydrolase CYLD [Cynoglossus semilaevis]|uniref:ubiquitin carboxyl-terminal hydrolase CYLD n=1 Tax=Cynoglossus semilaevis TaxID=244447 RepID=UPI0004966CD6|nr:ubiquitin carboxyl-terminal hydrolase CYLD-like [Cynoglossus semilaevis]
MEPRTVMKSNYFIVIRGKTRKGFSRGCIGRVETELPNGEVMGLLYCSGSNAVTPKSGGVVRREDTYPLTCHQAQLLLFISSASKRLELLCNPQLFSAICDLSPNDLVVVRHKKGHMPGLVKNLMQIGRKENKDNLYMLGFEVEFVDSDHNLSSKKPTSSPLFSAADIIQVVPSYSVPLGLQWKDGQCQGQGRKAVTRINSMPNIGSSSQQRQSHSTELQRPVLSHYLGTSPVPLEVGSMVEVVSSTGITVYGVIRWMGVLPGKTEKWAGIELDYDVNGCSDGKREGLRYFTCKGNRALFVPVTKCSPDGRFVYSSTGRETPKLRIEMPPVPPYEESEDNVSPIPESEALSLLVGRMKGIQGHINSCYLDATLFSLFSSSVTLDNICQQSADTEQPITCTLKKIINRLRRQGFVPAESVMDFRKQLGCDTFKVERVFLNPNLLLWIVLTDPEEFITVLFQKVLSLEPLLKLRTKREASHGAYTLQILLEKDQMEQVPTVQQLLDTSCMSGELKFEDVPSFLIVQMPRFGNAYKMFPHIIPSTELDITDLLYNSPRECFICGHLAQYECLQCLSDRKLQPGRIKQYCSTCNTQVHSHHTRQSHSPKALEVSLNAASVAPVPRHTMQLFAVLCIHTSHYVSFVKYGSDPHAWLFFDSMADRCGDDHNGYNIPEIQACPEVGDFLHLPVEELTRSSLSQVPELMRRLLCDSYMFLYENPAGPLCQPNHQVPEI